MLANYETVLVDVEDEVAWVTLNRPDKRNAVSPKLSGEMINVFRTIDADPHVRVVVLTGAGTSFCAGMDIKELFTEHAENPQAMARGLADSRAWMWDGITRLSKPVIAMVNGYCFGGGFTPVIASDIAIAGSEATFGLSEINWGHFLGAAVSKLVVDTMGRRAASYYTLTGERFDAETARAFSLVTMVVPQAELRARTAALAQVLRSKGAEALQANKEILRVAGDLTVDQCYDYALAKQDQLRARDRAGLRNAAIDGFLNAKTYKPGFEGVRR